MHSHLIDLCVDTISIDTIRIDLFKDHPEIEIEIILRNKAHKKIGFYRLSSQKYVSEIQYNVPEDIKKMIYPLIETIKEDVFTKYLQQN